MGISEAYANTATIGSTIYSLPNNSTTLTPITVDGVYQVFVDFDAMGAGDTYAVTIIEKTVSGGTQRTIYEATLEGVQTATFVTPSLILMHGWDVVAIKLAGTDRSISWSIRTVN